MRAGLHSISAGFVNGLAAGLQSVEEGFVRALHTGYVANGVNIDGTNDYLTRGAGLTGAADSKLISISLWAKKGSDILSRIFTSASAVGGGSVNGGIRITANTNNAVQIQGHNSGGTNTILLGSSNNSFEAADGWRHILFSCDRTDTAKRFLYVQDVSDLSFVTTYDNVDFDFTVADWAIGAQPDGSSKFNGDIADFWIAFGVYTDFSVESNRRKFISATGKPVFLGVSGEIPTGSAPTIFLAGSTSNWEINRGSGGGFTEVGALTDASSSPSS